MKSTLTLTLILLAFSSCLTKNNCEVITDKTACEISEKQYRYFVDALKETYASEDEPQLFNLFLNDLFTAYRKDSGMLAHNTVSFGHDIKRLEAVNALLKVRDTQHYYYFYPEEIFWKRERRTTQDSLSNNKEIAPNNFSKNQFESYLGLTPFPYIFTIGNKEQPALGGIQLFEGIRFVDDIKQIDSRTTSYIFDSIENSGGVYYYPLATFIVNNAKDELDRPEIRRVLSVIYWKLLCLYAEVDL